MKQVFGILALVTCILLLGITGPARAQEDRDRGILQGFLEDNLSSAGREVRIEGFEGALSGRATVAELTVADAQGVWLTLESVVFDWNRGGLVRGALEINELSAKSITIARAPQTDAPPAPTPEATPFALPDLPISVEIGRFAVDDLTLGAPLLGQAARFTVNGTASLAGGDGRATLDIRRTGGPEGNFAFEGAYSNSTRQLALNLDLTEGSGGIAATLLGLPGRPALRFTVAGDGPITDVTTQITLATDGVERLGGTVALGSDVDADDASLISRTLRVDLGGDLRPLVDPEYRTFLGADVRLQAAGVRAADGALDLSDLSLQAAALSLDGQLAVSAAGWPERFDLALRIAPPEGAPAGAPVILSIPGPATQLARADLRLGYDASGGDAWRLEADVDGFDRAGVTLDRATLVGQGVLSRDLGAVNGTLDLDLVGMALADPDLTAAIGTMVSGTVGFDWRMGEALGLPVLRVSGSDYALDGAATVEGVAGQIELAIDSDIRLEAQDLSRFATLAGLDLAGAAAVRIDGRVAPVSGAFDLAVSGTTTDLAIGQPRIDPLISGNTTLDLVARRDETGVTLDRLRIAGDAALINAGGQVATASSDLDLDLTISDGRLVLPGADGAITFVGRVGHNGPLWQAQGTLGAPGGTALTLDAETTVVDAAPGPFSAVLDLEVEDLRAYAGLAGRPLTGSIDIAGRAGGDLRDLAIGVDVAGTARDVTTGIAQADALLAGFVRLDTGAARGADGSITLNRFDLSGETARVTANGTIATGAIDLALDATVEDASVLLPGAFGRVSFTGRVGQTGNDVLVDGTLGVPGATELTLDAVTTLIDAAPGPFEAELDLNVGDLSVFSSLAQRPIGGAIAVSGTASGDLRDLTVAADLQGTTRDITTGIAQADALLAGLVRLDTVADRAADGRITLDRLSIDGGALRLSAQGSVAPGAVDLLLDAGLPNAAVLLPGYDGAVSFTGRVAQDGADVTIDGTLGAPGATALTLNAGTTLIDAAPGPVRAKLDLTVGDLSAFAALAQRPLSGALTLAGTVTGDLRDLAFEAVADATSRNLAIGIAEADRILRGQGTYGATLRRDGDGTVVFQRLDLRTPELVADVSGSLGDARSRLRYDLQLRDLALFVPGLNGAVTADGTLAAASGPWAVTSALTGPGGTRANVSGAVARDVSTANLSITGAAPLALANRFVAPTLVEGMARFDLGLNGPLAVSSLSGSVETSGAQVTAPNLRLGLTGLGATVRLGSGAADISAGGALSGGGRLSVDGRVSIAAPYTADLTLALAGASVSQTGLYETTVDGQVTVSGPLTGGAFVQGNLALGPTELRIPDGAGAGGGAIPELIHLNEPAAVRLTRSFAGLIETGRASGPSVAYPLDVTVNAPSRIFVRGRGLDAELGGSLRLTGTTAAIVTAGQFDLIRGRLDILGKRLVLTEASASLQGDFNPYVRAVATTESDGTEIQIVVEGPASTPEVSFSSSPDLPEDEILARLLFGRDITQISPIQALQIANAVRVLAGRGGEGVVGRLRSNFGLDDLDVTTDENGEAGLRVGKYISDNIYTDVTVDTTGTSEINLNLQISPSVTARGSVTSDGNSGIGIYFERDY